MMLPLKCREDREYQAVIALERTQGRLLRSLLLPGYSRVLQAWLECRDWQRRFSPDANRALGAAGLAGRSCVSVQGMLAGCAG